MILKVVLAALCVLASFATSASAGGHHGGAATFCPRGGLNPDGCAGVLASVVLGGLPGSVQHPDFFAAYAFGSDISVRRPAWNMAGVDYGVGAYTPDTSLIDATVGANLPSGCAAPNASDIIICSGSGSLVLAHLKFINVRLQISSGSYSSITFLDDHFQNGAASDGTSNLIRINNQSVANVLTFKNVTLDANGINYPANLGIIIQDFRTAANATTSFTYNACLNMVAKCFVNFQGLGPVQFNYFEGFEHGVGNTNHQEPYLLAGGTTPSYSESYNTYLQPPIIATGGSSGTVAFNYVGTGSAGFDIQSVSISNNTYVAYPQASQLGQSASFSYGEYDAISMANNYVYTPGSTFCFAANANASGAGITSPTFSGNVNMVDGRAITAFGACP